MNPSLFKQKSSELTLWVIKHLLMCSLWMTSTAWAENTAFSLFLTPSEQTTYNTSMKDNDQWSDDHLTLQALMYIDKSNWSFWCNGQQVTPTSIPDHIHVKSVTEHHVDLIWTKDEVPLHLTLSLSESFNSDGTAEINVE